MCHWYALCGRFNGITTEPSTGRVAGNAVVGKKPGFAASTCAAVSKLAVGEAEGGACLKKTLAILLGKVCCTNWTNCGVSTVVVSVVELDAVSPKKPPKKNTLSLMIGPPKVPPYSFLLNTGIAVQPVAPGAQYWNSVRAVSTLLVKYSDAVPWKLFVPGLVNTWT